MPFTDESSAVLEMETAEIDLDSSILQSILADEPPPSEDVEMLPVELDMAAGGEAEEENSTFALGAWGEN